MISMSLKITGIIGRGQGRYCLRREMGDGNIINNLRHGSLFGYNSNNIR
jgi:hypothetical protein